MATPKITVPTRYKHCTIAPAAGGFDVFEGNNRWFHVKTQKQAKWWASIASRLADEFMSHPVKPMPVATEDHTPKTKE